MPCCNTPSCSRAIHQQHPGRHETSAKSHRSDVVSLPSDLRQPCRFQNRGMMTDRHANSALLTYQMPISSTSPDLTSAATGSSHLAQFLLITALSSVCSPVTNCTNAFTWVGAPCHLMVAAPLSAGADSILFAASRPTLFSASSARPKRRTRRS